MIDINKCISENHDDTMLLKKTLAYEIVTKHACVCEKKLNCVFVLSNDIARGPVTYLYLMFII